MDALAQAAAKIRELEAKLAAAEKAKDGKLTIKVSAKGAVSVYGMGKWPVTLYHSQWHKLLGAADDIVAFIEANKSKLASKDSATTAEAPAQQ